MGKFVISKAKNGEFVFNLRADNGQSILTSETYKTKAACTNGIESVRKHCADDNRYERKVAANNKHFFNLKASNGQVIGKSEMYESPSGMENGIASIKKNGLTEKIVED
jgi:uncharacterized protein YegP (UPF0339 family)